MANVLFDWLDAAQSDLRKLGFETKISLKGNSPNCSAVDVDGFNFGGRICYWPPDLFEFHFIDLESGEAAFLETVNLSSVDNVSDYVKNLISKLTRAA